MIVSPSVAAPELRPVDGPDAAGEQGVLIARGARVVLALTFWAAGQARGGVGDLLAVVEAELQLVVELARVEELGHLEVRLLLRILGVVVVVVVVVRQVRSVRSRVVLAVPARISVARRLEGHVHAALAAVGDRRVVRVLVVREDRREEVRREDVRVFDLVEVRRDHEGGLRLVRPERGGAPVRLIAVAALVEELSRIGVRELQVQLRAPRLEVGRFGRGEASGSRVERRRVQVDRLVRAGKPEPRLVLDDRPAEIRPVLAEHRVLLVGRPCVRGLRRRVVRLPVVGGVGVAGRALDLVGAALGHDVDRDARVLLLDAASRRSRSRRPERSRSRKTCSCRRSGGRTDFRRCCR